MPFQDVIDNYSNGQTGSVVTADGTVNYTVTSTASTVSNTNTDQGARISADGSERVEVAFDDPVYGVTLKFDRSNDPEIYKITINDEEVNVQDLIDSGDATFSSVTAGTNPPQPGTHYISNGGVTSSGNFDNGSVGFLTLNLPVESIGVYGTGGNSGNFDLVEIGIDSTTSAVVCFASDTDLQTPQGPRQVGTLGCDDQVLTLSGQARRIIATNTRHVRLIELYRETRLLPIRIAAGALGGGLPTRDLLVSRQHRVLVASRIARRICGDEEVLIPAFRLVGIPGIEVAHAMQPVTYCHILLDRHDVVLANGAPAETLFVGPVAVTAVRDGLDDDTPLLSEDAKPMTPARSFPTTAQTEQIVAAHIRHQRPLLETRVCVSA